MTQAEVQARKGTAFDRQTLARLKEIDAPGAEAVRLRALETFESMSMPSPQTEEWRYTDLTEFDLSAFEPYAPEPAIEGLDALDEGILKAAGSIEDRAGVAVQHNSTVVTARLDPDLDARGVHFESIDAALRDHPRLLADRLGHAVALERTNFSALHAAFRSGGTFVHVPKDVRVELPLQTVTYVDHEGLAVFPHTLIVLEEGAELTFIDRYVSPNLAGALSLAKVELFAGPNSKLRYFGMQDWGDGMTHLSVQRAHLERDAEVRSLAVAFGASLSRMEAESLLTGDGSSSEMLGAYFGHASQHFDFRSIQDHAGSRTSSDLLYKGALRERSRAVYAGTVIIQPGAHKCDAYQTNRNILLSDHSKADSIPNLEILCNDPVRCGHAASVGPVDDDTLFYMQTRGIPYAEAKRLIVTGFFQEVLDRVGLAEIREELERTIAAEIEAPDAG